VSDPARCKPLPAGRFLKTVKARGSPRAFAFDAAHSTSPQQKNLA